MAAAANVARSALAVKRCGFRVSVELGARGYDVDCRATYRARAFEAWVQRWRELAPELPLERLIERAMFASTQLHTLERGAVFWQTAHPEWSERRVYERAQLDIECALRFQQRRRRVPRLGFGRRL